MTEHFKALITGDDQFRRVMGALGQAARRPRLAMQNMAAVMEDQTEENFAAEGRPKWPTLSEVTVRARLGGGKAYRKDGRLRVSAQRTRREMKMLQDSGLLAGSVHSVFGDGYAATGAARPYARVQQLGGQAGRGRKVTIPSRPYLPFTADFKLQPEAERELLRTAMDHLRRAVE